MKLYHGSTTKIETFDNSRPMFFSAKESDTKLAIESFCKETGNKTGYVYTIEVKDFELCTDFMQFHTGEILQTSEKDVVKMKSADIDNWWFCVRNVNNFKPKQLIY